MGIYTNTVNIGGTFKKVVVINYDENDIPKDNKKIDQLHHIHILDRSGSMRMEIDNLIDNVQKTIDVIDDNDLISIIWFSSPGQYRTLIKGARKVDNVNKLLDTLRSTLATTCFSDPLKETEIIINELSTLCPNISITLFTDGQPVVPWSYQEEEERIFKILDNIKDKILSFNTVGYGNWYNKDLLIKMAAISEFGSFCHSSRIDDYLNIFNHNFEKIGDMVFDSIELKSDNNDIIYMNRSFTKMENGFFKLSRLNKRKNQFFIINKDDNEFNFEYNGVKYNSSTFDGVGFQTPTILNFLHAYVYNLYYFGDRQYSLDILSRNLYDKYLIDSHMRAFTYDECSDHMKKLLSAVFNSSKRMIDGKCDHSYIPKDDDPCVMDVLKTLQSYDDSYFVPFSNKVEKYKRITRKTEDTYNLFEMTNEEVLAPFSDFVYNKEHMNLSLRVVIPGHVIINPNIAKSANLPDKIESRIFRNFTIIKDGTLNMKEVEIDVPENVISEIRNFSKDIVRDVTENKETNRFRCVVSLEKLPIINRLYIDQSSDLDKIFNIIREINDLEARNKIIGYYIDKIVDESPVGKKEGAFKNYTNDQIVILEQHGLDKYLNYKGVNRTQAKKDDSDSYETRTMEFYISGCKSFPKVEEFIDRLENNKNLTPAMEIMKNQYEFIIDEINDAKADINKLNTKLRNVLRRLEKDCNIQLIENRNKLNTLKMAKIITGDWFKDLKANDKGLYEYSVDDVKMIVKVDRVTEYF